MWLQSERLKVVGELASGTAHNFNNTLQIVLSGAQVALLNIESGNYAKAEEALDAGYRKRRVWGGNCEAVAEFHKHSG